MPESTLLDAIQALKITPRSGWIHAGVGITDIESVADHSFGVALLSLLLSEKLKETGIKVDVSRSLKMAILHDLSESLTFDISKRYLEFMGERGRGMKRELEDSANRRLLASLPPALRREAALILREHQLDKTTEAHIVTAADRMDLLLQLNSYQRRGYRGRILTQMKKEATAEIRAMKNPVFMCMLAEMNE